MSDLIVHTLHDSLNMTAEIPWSSSSFRLSILKFNVNCISSQLRLNKLLTFSTHLGRFTYHQRKGDGKNMDTEVVQETWLTSCVLWYILQKGLDIYSQWQPCLCWIQLHWRLHGTMRLVAPVPCRTWITDQHHADRKKRERENRAMVLL